MSPIGIGLLGAGIFAKEAHLPALAALGDSVSLKACYSRSEESATDVAKAAQQTLKLSAPPDVYFDSSSSHTLDALLARSDVHAVLIVLPITTQPAVVLQSLAAGKHVLSEKPVAPDVAAGIKLIEEYESTYKPKGLIWRVAENFEAEPGYRAAARVLREGEIGTLSWFTARAVGYVDENSKYYKTPWRTVPDYQGGFLLDGGVHTAAVLRLVLPSALATLSGFASLNKKILAPHDTITSIIKTTDGIQGMLEMSFAAPHGTATGGNGYKFFGGDGWMTIEGANVDGKNVIRVVVKRTIRTKKENGDVDVRVEEETIEERQSGVEAEAQSFVKAVGGHDDGQGLGEPRGALEDVALIQAALNSQGEPVDLKQLVKTG